MSVPNWNSESKARVTEQNKTNHLKCYYFGNTEKSGIFTNIPPSQEDGWKWQSGVSL